MARYFEVDHLAPAQAFSRDDIEAAMSQQKITIGEGDVVFFHTGWTDAMLDSDPEQWVSTIPGIDNDAARYLASVVQTARCGR